MLSVIPRRRKPTPLAAVASALPHVPSKNERDHTRAVAVAGVTAALAAGTAAGAALFTRRVKPGGEEQAPDGAEE